MSTASPGPMLPGPLREAVEEALGAAVEAARPVGGGCIHEARLLELANGERAFLKSSPRALPGIFESEEEGLEALAAVGALRVPASPRAGGGEGGVPPFLVMEAIAPGRRGPRFSETFGRGFAALHRRSGSERFGFGRDGYIGATPQPNGWMDDWVELFRERRLGFQLRLARERGLADRRLSRLGDRLLDRLEGFLAEPAEAPCLLHGDLWGGNYLADEAGEPVLIDPAAYYGRREADLAMTHLFGGFDARFYAAYEEAWPLEPGAGERLEIYKLYHLLNHLNLFGGGYLESCLGILRRFG